MRRMWRKQLQAPGSQRGFLLVVAVVLIVMVGLVLSAMAFLKATGAQSAVLHLGGKQALYIAESGIERALYGFLQESTSCPDLSYTATLGTGGFSTTGTPYNPVSSTLTAGISAADTVIPVTSVAGYAPFGRVSIGSERINYGAVSTTSCAPFSAPCLTAARRGADGSMAAAHAAGQAVAQNQCLIAATGTVGDAQRVLRVAVQAGAGAIAFGGGSSNNTNNSTSLTWPHTVPAGGSNRLLVVGVALRNGSGQTVSGVTHAGQPLTLAVARANGTNIRVEIWYRVAPATGTNDVVVTLSGSAFMAAGAMSFTGVDQTTPVDASNSNVGTSTAPSVVVATTSNNSWVVDALAHRIGATPGVGPGQVLGWGPDQSGGGPNGAVGAGSYETTITPGNVTMSWSLSSSRNWSIAAAALRPAGGGGGVVMWQEDF